MATRTTSTASETTRARRHPAQSRELEDWLDSQGVEWVFHPDVAVDAFNEAESLNNQVRFQPLVPATVEQYAAAMTEGAKFPPILVNSKRNKFVRLDGNHRVAAARRVGVGTVHAYEALVRGDAAVLLAFKANNRNGLPNTEEERIQHAIHLIRNGASQAAAAAATVVSEKTLRYAWAREEASQRADEAGIARTEWDSLSIGVKARLRGVSTDEGFKAGTTLAYQARLTLEELSEVTTEMNRSKSGRKQEQIVRSYTEVYSDRIAASAGGVLTSGGRARARTPRQAFGLVLSSFGALPENLDVIADGYHGQERVEAAARAQQAGERLLSLAAKLSTEQ